MGSLCVFPLSSMESVFQFYLWYYWFCSLFRLLCLCGLGWLTFVYMYLGCGAHWVCEWKAGGSLWCKCLDCAYLFWTSGVCDESMWQLNLTVIKVSTYPIAFACVLSSMISSGVLVTSYMVGNALLSICRCKTHEPRLCTDIPYEEIWCNNCTSTKVYTV